MPTLPNNKLWGDGSINRRHGPLPQLSVLCGMKSANLQVFQQGRETLQALDRIV